MNNFFFPYKISREIEINKKKSKNEKKQQLSTEKKILTRKYKYITKIISQVSCQSSVPIQYLQSNLVKLGLIRKIIKQRKISK